MLKVRYEASAGVFLAKIEKTTCVQMDVIKNMPLNFK